MTASQRFLWTVLFALILAVGFYGLRYTDAQSSSLVSGQAGVVDIVRVFNEYEKSEFLTEQLKQEKAALDEEQKQKKEVIEFLVVERDSYKPESEEYKNKRNELIQETINLKAWAEFHQELMLDEHKRLTAQLYAEIVNGVKRVAEQEGFSLVLYLDGEQLSPSKNIVELRDHIRQRKVVHHDQSVDLTQRVLDSLNAGFRLSRQ